MSGARGRNRDGSALAQLLLLTVMLSGLALALSTRYAASLPLVDRTRESDRALYIARAGYARACAEILVPTADWNGLGGGLIYENQAFGGGDYDLRLTPLAQDEALLVCTGRWGIRERVLELRVRRLGTGEVVIAALEDADLDRWLGEEDQG